MADLGDKVKDTITGYEGVVMAVAFHIHGCKRVLVEPIKLGKDGLLADNAWWMDEPRVKVVKKGFVKPTGQTPESTAPAPGGPRSQKA